MKAVFGLLAVLLLANFVFAVDTIVVSSDNEADVGAAEAAAAGASATLVTVEWGSDDSDALARITALNPKKVIVIGGALAVPEGLESKIKARVVSVERLSGEDRYETAALIAERFFANSTSAIIIQGDDPATIKAKIAEARASGIPILYMKKDGVPEKVKVKLKTLKIKEAKVEPSAETDEDSIKAGLGNITTDIRKVNKTEKALAQIAEAEDEIGKARELINATNETTIAAKKMLALAENELSLAKDALDAGKYGEAFGQATAAENHAEAAIKIFKKRAVGWYKGESDKVEAEIRSKGFAKVKGEVETEQGKSKIECERKIVAGKLTRVCTTGKEREREDLRDKFEVKANAGASGALAKVELKYASALDNSSAIAQEILGKLQASAGNLSAILKIENETEELREKMEGAVKAKDGIVRVKFEYKFPLNATGRDGIIAGIAAKFSSLTAGQIQGAIISKLEKKENKEEKETEKKEVEIEGSKFKPATLNINAGDTVTWKNKDSAAHTATSTGAPSGGEFDSGSLGKGAEYSKTFNVTGTYDYYCSIHPSMKGKLIVK